MARSVMLVADSVIEGMAGTPAVRVEGTASADISGNTIRDAEVGISVFTPAPGTSCLRH